MSNKQRGAELTARRRTSAERIKRRIKTEGAQPLPEDPPLIDPSDIVLSKEKHGRSKFRPEYIDVAREMCRLGATDIEVARGLSISLSCLWRWQSEHEDFFRAFLEGKDHCDDRVERAMYHRAVGYSFPAVKIFNNQGVPVVVPYIEHVPPDVGAQSRWLKHRRKDDWGDQNQLDLTSGAEAFANIWNAIATGQVLPMLKASADDFIEHEDDDAE